MKNKNTGRGAPNDPIIVEVPGQLKQLVEPFMNLVSRVEKEAKHGEGGHPVDYGQLEEDIRDLAADIERASHSTILPAYQVDSPRVSIQGKTYFQVGCSQGTYYSQAGPITFERPLFRETGRRNGKTVDPICLRIGAVGRGWLPQTAELMAYMIQQGTSREAAAAAKKTGRLPYSRMSFERIPHELGQRFYIHQADIEDRTIQEFEVPQQAHGISVGIDRVSIPMEEPAEKPQGRPKKNAPKNPITRAFRMAYCGSVTLHDDEGKAIQTFRYGAMPQTDIEVFCWRMANDVKQIMQKKPDLKLVLLADGAHEMWDLLEGSFPEDVYGKRHRLVDFWHLLEKLSPAADMIYGEGEGKKTMHQWRMFLRNRSSAARTILHELQESGCEHVPRLDKYPVHEAITYLENHAKQDDRMNYAAAIRKHLPIGSGNTEATCKTLVEVRMKRAGSRWKTLSAEEVLQLRALALSDRWDAAMKLLHAEYRTSVRRTG